MLGKLRIERGHSFLCPFCHIFRVLSVVLLFFELEVNRGVNVDTTVSPCNSIDL